MSALIAGGGLKMGQVIGSTNARGEVAVDRPITVQQVVLMGRYRSIGWFHRPKREDRDAARDALLQVGLADRAGDSFGSLSGGQRQRVLIARAIAQDAKLLLLDEPFNGVDSTTQDVLLEVLSSLRSAGAAVVMATHDLSVAHLACGHACVLNRHLVAFGPSNRRSDLMRSSRPTVIRKSSSPRAPQ